MAEKKQGEKKKRDKKAEELTKKLFDSPVMRGLKKASDVLRKQREDEERKKKR